MPRIQLINGLCQDASGEPLAGGYITLRLSQDAQAPGNRVIGAGRDIIAPLDSSGNVQASPATHIWPNDQLQPGTVYEISVYSHSGELVWGPNVVKIVAGVSSTFDIGTIFPPAYGSDYTLPGGGLGVLVPIQEMLTGSGSVFTVPTAPAGGVILAIFYNAGYLDPSHYTLSNDGSTVTLDFTVQSGDILYAIHF